MVQKIYHWFDIVDELVPVMVTKTQGTPFAPESDLIQIEYEKIKDEFFDHPLTADEAIQLLSRIMDIQQRLISMVDRVERPN